MKRWKKVILCVGFGLLVAGCPKSKQQYNAGLKAENIQDYDSALEYYQKALAGDPNNANLRIKFNQARFEASESHIKKGLALREKGELQPAAGVPIAPCNMPPSICRRPATHPAGRW